MVRFLHTSDTHLGHQQYPRSDPRTGLNQREQDIYDTWAAFIDQAIEAKPDAVVHAGDLFDGVRPSNRALAAAMDGFLRLSQAGIPTIVIAGNHDHPKMRGTGSPFRLFDHLDHIHVAYKGRVESTTVQGATFHAVPQCSSPDQLRDQVTAIDTSGPGDHVLVIHGAVTTIEAFKHAEFNEQSLDPDWFERFDHVCLGHYHNTTEVTPKAWYCGAPDRVSIAEAGQEKGYLDVDLAGSVQHRPLPVRPMMDLPRLQADGLEGAAIEDAAIAAIGRAPEGAIARLRILEVDASLRGGLDQRRIRRSAEHLVHLQLQIDWADQGRPVEGRVEIGALSDEFDAYQASQSLDGIDRDRIRRMARELLG